MPGLIDVHHHFMSQAYLDAVGVERAASPGSAGHVEPCTARQSLEFMDMAGIAAAVISVSAPGIDMGTPRKTAELARRCNEGTGRNGANSPGGGSVLWRSCRCRHRGSLARSSTPSAR